MPHTPLRTIEHGQAVVELAIVLPILALLLFGILQLGITFNHYLALTDAVRAGARAAAVSRHDANPVATTEAKLRAAAPDLKQSDLDVTVDSTWAPGTPVTVTATYPYDIDLLGVVVKSGHLTSSTQERVE
jgi:Flp pilus assembly protein TadG